jgi:hypothetical protein
MTEGGNFTDDPTADNTGMGCLYIGCLFLIALFGVCVAAAILMGVLQ